MVKVYAHFVRPPDISLEGFELTHEHSFLFFSFFINPLRLAAT